MSYKDEANEQQYGSVFIKSHYRIGSLLEAKGWIGNILG
jgi:hypothetical protein